MGKKIIFFIVSMTFLSIYGQSKPSITDRKKIDIEQITTEFEIQNYFNDENLSKKNEYSVVRNTKLFIQKKQGKNSIYYNLSIWSPKRDTIANFGTINFDYIEGLTNKENSFFGLVFKSTKELNEQGFKERVDYFKDKLGMPNFQFREAGWDLVGTKLYSWKLKGFIYVIHLDGQNGLCLHLINFEKYKEIQEAELGWRLIDI
ncbi:hypothetical protein [Chryseobacterium paludis]|uniref:hypothetical protein n=1 Tax=Chryseobacterium paludis TaxID=2956784 RepID=UPI0021BF4874|nr:hypothetical protein [Chryseobacterium paludis]